MCARRIGPFTPKASNGGSAADGVLNSGATAAIAHNDLLAIGIMRRLAQRGLGVPDDISVVGFDDIFAASLCSPGLTTLGGPYAEAGRAAVELLLDATGPVRTDKEGTQLTLPSELVIRGSTGQRPA